jgi:hypothetical protein
VKRPALVTLAASVLACALVGHGASAPPLPAELHETGYGAVAMTEFTPRHPLWTDGATKRRWISLPVGTSVDKTNPDAWDFPVGTKLWKEFSFGRAIETRFIERLADGSWRYATYIWNESRTTARLAPKGGAIVPVDGAPGGRYAIPSRDDCLACHEGAPVPVLGYSAVQLEETLRGVSETARAAAGYLHGNCGHCHNDGALGGVDLRFAMAARDPAGSHQRTRESLTARSHDVLRRVRSDNPYVRMPPVGVRLPDAAGAAVLERWLRAEIDPTKEKSQ